MYELSWSAKRLCKKHHIRPKKKKKKKPPGNQKRKEKRAHYVLFEIPFCSMIYWPLSFVSVPSLEDSSLQCTHVGWLDRDACWICNVEKAGRKGGWEFREVRQPFFFLSFLLSFFVSFFFPFSLKEFVRNIIHLLNCSFSLGHWKFIFACPHYIFALLTTYTEV